MSVNIRIYGFLAEYCTLCHTASDALTLSQTRCHLFPRQTSAHTHPVVHMIHQTRPLTSITPWSNSVPASMHSVAVLSHLYIVVNIKLLGIICYRSYSAATLLLGVHTDQPSHTLPNNNEPLVPVIL